VYSCSSSECKELLARLGWREVIQALDDPALVVELTKFRQRAPQFLHVLEYLGPQQLLFQCANEPLDTAVGVSYGLRRNVTVKNDDSASLIPRMVKKLVLVAALSQKSLLCAR
jgi:hypothetical protein